MNLNIWIIRIIIFSPVLFLTNCSEDNGEKIPDYKDHGGLIAYCYQPAQGDIHQIYLINEDGTGNRKIVESPLGLNHIDWSSDALKVACVGYTELNFLTWSIFIFNADGSGLSRLTSEEKVWDSDPRWSPNDSLIAFTRIYPNKNYKEEIWIMNADGSNQHFSGINGVLGGWSPDGRRFVFSASDGNDYEIYTCRIDGTGIQVITNTTVHEIYASYSPDGTRILFSSCRVNIYTSQNTASYEIGIINSDGTGKV